MSQITPDLIIEIKSRLATYQDSLNTRATPDKRAEHYCALHQTLSPSVIERLLDLAWEQEEMAAEAKT